MWCLVCTGCAFLLLAQLLRGELHACGRTPALLVVEGCSKAKVGGPRVRDAMLGAHTHSRVGPKTNNSRTGRVKRHPSRQDRVGVGR